MLVPMRYVQGRPRPSPSPIRQPRAIDMFLRRHMDVHIPRFFSAIIRLHLPRAAEFLPQEFVQARIDWESGDEYRRRAFETGCPGEIQDGVCLVADVDELDGVVEAEEGGDAGPKDW